MVSRRVFLAAAAASLLGLGMGSSYLGGVEVTRLRFGLGRRVLALADLHVHARPRLDVVELARGLRPDIVLVLGDAWDEMSPGPWAALETLRELRRLAGDAAAVLGNHEYAAAGRGGPGIREAVRLLEDAGYAVLRDTAVELRGLLVGGLDWRSNPGGYGAAAARLGAVELVASHSPDALPHLPRGRGLLLLAGHTHGGQVCLPVNRSIVTNSVYGYRWGLYRCCGNTAYVSRGLGEMLPPRLFCRRQAVIVE